MYKRRSWAAYTARAGKVTKIHVGIMLIDTSLLLFLLSQEESLYSFQIAGWSMHIRRRLFSSCICTVLFSSSSKKLCNWFGLCDARRSTMRSPRDLSSISSLVCFLYTSSKQKVFRPCFMKPPSCNIWTDSSWNKWFLCYLYGFLV
jgi:hypothetical protein